MVNEINLNKYIKGLIYSIFILIPFLTNIKSEAFDLNIVPSLLKELSSLLLLISIFLLWAMKVINTGEVFVKNSNIYIPIIAFIIYSGVSYFFVTDTVNFFQYFLFYILCISIFLTLFNFSFEKKDFIFLVNIFIYSALYVSIFGILQFNFPDLMPVYDTTNGGGGFGNKNFGGQYVAVMIPFVFMKLFNGKNFQKNLNYFFVLFVSFIYLFYVAAMQILVALVSVLFLFPFFYLIDRYKNKNKRLIVFQKSSIVKILITVLILLSALQVVKFFESQYYDRQTQSSSANVTSNDSKKSTSDYSLQNFSSKVSNSNGRIQLWINSIEMFKDNPLFGVGTGQWYLSYFDYANKKVIDSLWTYQQRADHPHNEYVKILTELGLVGFLIFLTFFFIVFIQIYKYLLTPVSTYRVEVLSLVASFLIFTFLAFFSRLSAVFVIPFLGFSFLGLALSFTNNDYKKITFRKNFKVLISIPLIPILFILYIYIDRLIQDYHYRTIEVIRNSHSWAKKVISYKPLLPYYSQHNAINLTLLKYYDDAHDALSRLLNYQPNDVETFRLMANNYIMRGDLKNALKLYERILTIEPNNYVILRAITQLMYLIKEPKHTKHYYGHFKRVVEKVFNGELFFSPYHFIWDESVKLAITLRDFKYAIYILNKMFNYLPEKRTAANLSILGVLYFNTENDPESAKKLFDEAIKLNSGIVDEIPIDIYTQLYNENSSKK